MHEVKTQTYDKSKVHAMHAGPRCAKYQHFECHSNAMYLYMSLHKCPGACIRSGYRTKTMKKEKNKTAYPHYWVETKDKVWDISPCPELGPDDWLHMVMDKEYFYSHHGIELVDYWDKNNFVEMISFINLMEAEPEKPWQILLNSINPGKWKVFDRKLKKWI